MTTDPIDSGGNQAPPPPFSTQRKRPAINNLGIETRLNPDLKTPETPTPNITTETSKTSEIILPISKQQHIPIGSATSTTRPSMIQSSSPQYEPFTVEGIREPLLVNVFEALTDFQNSYDCKSQKIIYLENQMQSINYQLNQREVELQQLSAERISNFNTLEAHKKQLKELKERLGEFEKYETLIASKFSNLEALMSEMCSTKEQFLVKEKDLTEELEAKQKCLDENLENLRRITLEKESAERKVELLENDVKDKCTEFNGRIYHLNAEAKSKAHEIESLSAEREILLADLKSITSDRDRNQKECSWTLKELTDLAVNEKFSCDVKNLGSLERTVRWVKEKCLELLNVKTGNEIDLIALKENLQELQLRFDELSRVGESKQSSLIRDNNKLKMELEENKSAFRTLNENFYRIQSEVDVYKEFKSKACDLGYEADDNDWIDKILEKLGDQTLECKNESLTAELTCLKANHVKEIEKQKEEFSRLLREETLKIISQRDALEAELEIIKEENEKIKISSLSLDASATSINHTQQQQMQSQKSTVIDPDLTAIIRDLKETSGGLFSNHQHHAVRSSKRSAASAASIAAVANSSFNSTKKQQTKKRHITVKGNKNNSSYKETADDSFMKSPSSVNSNDIWNLFK